ncbi:hypothetical protein MK280_16490, partial [Myxococcota bacterium]|nr:hypothetical protein [Myxococcota bacterium]
VRGIAAGFEILEARPPAVLVIRSQLSGHRRLLVIAPEGLTDRFGGFSMPSLSPFDDCFPTGFGGG